VSSILYEHQCTFDSMLPSLKPTVLLSLPNELFLNYIFLSIQINVDRLFSYTFPILNHLDLRLTTTPENLSQMFVFTQLKVLTITLISDKLEIESMEQLTSYGQLISDSFIARFRSYSFRYSSHAIRTCSRIF